VRLGRLSCLTERIDGFAAAQERTDEQLTRLAAAQERTDGRMDQLTHRMDQLAESQQSMQRTFERFMVRTEEQFTSVRKEMREGYDQLDKKFDRLDEKHDSLEKKMDASFADVRKQLGGLSLSVGMGLEAYALDKIPRLLEMHCGFKTESVFPETFTDGGRTEEIDVVVRGSIAGEPAVVVCEMKTDITQTEVREFFGRVARVRSRLGCDDVRVLFFGYRATPETHGMIEAAGGWLALPAGILRINRQAG
jgi:exonuclease VII large subunit